MRLFDKQCWRLILVATGLLLASGCVTPSIGDHKGHPKLDAAIVFMKSDAAAVVDSTENLTYTASIDPHGAAVVWRGSLNQGIQYNILYSSMSLDSARMGSVVRSYRPHDSDRIETVIIPIEWNGRKWQTMPVTVIERSEAP